MKHTIPILALLALILNSASAAVPLKWTVETSRVQPAVFEAYQGETLTFEAAMQSHGKPIEAPVDYSFYWQTNGMGNVYWSTNIASAANYPTYAGTNVMFATWLPSMDVGARAYNCFIGAPGSNYHAAFQLRLRSSPGAVPNVIEQPPPVLDLAHTVVINPPWPTDMTIDTRIRQVIADDDITANVPTGMVKSVVSNTVDKAYVESLGISGGGSSIDTNAVIDIATSVVAPAVNAAVNTGRAFTSAAAEAGTNYTDSAVSSKRDKDDLSYGSCLWDFSPVMEAVPSLNNLHVVVNEEYDGWYLNLSTTEDMTGFIAADVDHVYANETAALEAVVMHIGASPRYGSLLEGKTLRKASDSLALNSALTSLSSQVSGLSSSKADQSALTSLSSQVSSLASSKADKSTTYTKTETDAALASKANSSTVTSLSSQVSSLSSSKANLMGGNIFYGDQWVANGDLNLAMAGIYIDRSGTGQEYIYGKWNGDMFAFEGTMPFLFLNEVYFSTAHGNRPYIDNSPITSEDDVEQMIGQSLSSKADQADLTPIRTAANDALSYSRGIYMYMSGTTNCYFSGTNYVIGAESTNRTAFALEDGMDLATVPCSMALWEIRDGARQCVWDQRDWTVWYWNFKLAQYRDEHDGRDAALRELIDRKCPLNWSSYTACGLTNAASDTTWIDTPKVVLSAGYAWQHQLTVDGIGYWGISGNGFEVGGSGTNSTLRITDWEGNEVLKIKKGNAMLAYLTGGSGVASGLDGEYMWYDMRCDAQPTGEFTVDLLDTFVEEGDNCPAEVREYEDRGNGVWRCYFRARPGINATACFARFKVQVGTETTVEYGTAPTIPALIVNGRKIAPVIPQNAQVGDTVVWKVVQ